MSPRKKLSSADRHTAREEVLRPCPALGYDRDSIGMHLMSCEAYRLAEMQFRRAIWLNPYERRFVIHLAMCLRRQGKKEEARECLRQLRPKDHEVQALADRLRDVCEP